MAITKTNLAALSALRGLNNANDLFSLATRRLSTGLRVERASDDPSGLFMSTRLQARLASLERLGIENQTSRSLVQTAESGVNTIIDHLQTIRTLALNSASSTTTTADRNVNQTQYESLRDEIDSIANNTIFNTKSLLDGSFATGTATLRFQVGPDVGNVITLNISTVTAAALGVDNLDLTTQAGASAAITAVDAAIDLAAREQASIGVTDSRLELGAALLVGQIATHEQAISGIVDADIAKETVRHAQAQILRQTSSAALAQANIFPQNVLAALLPSAN